MCQKYHTVDWRLDIANVNHLKNILPNKISAIFSFLFISERINESIKPTCYTEYRNFTWSWMRRSKMYTRDQQQRITLIELRVLCIFPAKFSHIMRVFDCRCLIFIIIFPREKQCFLQSCFVLISIGTSDCIWFLNVYRVLPSNFQPLNQISALIF